MIRIDYEIETIYGTFRDCLNYTEDEYALLTQEDLENEKIIRFDKWVDNIVNPPPPPSEADILAWIEAREKMNG